MTLANRIVQEVNRRGFPVKATELPTWVLPGDLSPMAATYSSEEVMKAIDEMERAHMLPFVNYSLPSMTYREKTIFFPQGTVLIRSTLLS